MADENLQFDRAEPSSGGPPSASCSRCQRSLEPSYFQVNGVVVCSRCLPEIEATWNRGTSATRFALSLFLGVMAAGAGAALYYGILAATGYELSIVAIAVGYGVGVAVRKGSNGRGGWRYQALAMFLTYTSIVSSYVPFLDQEALSGDTNLIGTLARLYAVPFLSGMENIIGLLIIGIGVYVAWSINKPATLSVTGPYQVGASGPATRTP
jgi:hypothetical protein